MREGIWVDPRAKESGRGGMAGVSADGDRSRIAGEPPELPLSMRDRVPFVIYRAAEESHALANEMLAGIGLSARQVGILTMVTELQPMTQKALGDALRIDRNTMVGLLDDLEERGYGGRQRHPRARGGLLAHRQRGPRH